MKISKEKFSDMFKNDVTNGKLSGKVAFLRLQRKALILGIKAEKLI